MLITLFTEPDGSVYLVSPKAENSAIKTNRLGNILQHEGIYNVEFVLPDLAQFNKSGFTTRDEAICYEQEIINKHLAELLVNLH